jgi:hypothetical protein
MTIVTLIRSQGDAGFQANYAIIQDAIWAFAGPDAGLEHAHVTTSGGKLRIALFLSARTPDDARSAGIRLCVRACRDSPALRGWEIST